MTTRRLESTIAALKEKIEKTKNETKEKLLALRPFEEESDRLKFEIQKTNDSHDEHFKTHATHLKALDHDFVQFKKDFYRRKRSAGATSESDDFHFLLEAKREDTRQLRENYLKLKAEVLSGDGQNNGGTPLCEICINEYNEEEHLPKALGCGHTICSKCLINLNKGDTDSNISCPFCRERCHTKTCPTNLIIFDK